MHDGPPIMVENDRLPPIAGETAIVKEIRFRTLRCYPLTGAVESRAVTVRDIVAEPIQSRGSERKGRAIDNDRIGSMDKKKQEG